ncbi:MAG TPA: hypothetical protein VGD50_07815 [Candidatus Baltobacteraceae bacterium]
MSWAVLDTGLFIAASRRDRDAVAIMALAVDEGAQLLVPAVVLTEATRGDFQRDAAINRLFDKWKPTIVPIDEDIARYAATLLGRVKADVKEGREWLVDALVVAVAAAYPGSHLVTTDIADIRRFVDADPSQKIKVVPVHP